MICACTAPRSQLSLSSIGVYANIRWLILVLQIAVQLLVPGWQNLTTVNTKVQNTVHKRVKSRNRTTSWKVCVHLHKNFIQTVDIPSGLACGAFRCVCVCVCIQYIWHVCSLLMQAIGNPWQCDLDIRFKNHSARNSPGQQKRCVIVRAQRWGPTHDLDLWERLDKQHQTDSKGSKNKSCVISYPHAFTKQSRWSKPVKTSSVFTLYFSTRWTNTVIRIQKGNAKVNTIKADQTYAFSTSISHVNILLKIFTHQVK